MSLVKVKQVKVYQFGLKGGSMDPSEFGKLLAILSDIGHRYGMTADRIVNQRVEGILLSPTDVKKLERRLGYPIAVSWSYDRPSHVANPEDRAWP